MEDMNRRKFLKTSFLTVAGLLIDPSFCKGFTASPSYVPEEEALRKLEKSVPFRCTKGEQNICSNMAWEYFYHLKKNRPDFYPIFVGGSIGTKKTHAWVEFFKDVWRVADPTWAHEEDGLHINNHYKKSLAETGDFRHKIPYAFFCEILDKIISLKVYGKDQKGKYICLGVNPFLLEIYRNSILKGPESVKKCLKSCISFNKHPDKTFSYNKLELDQYVWGIDKDTREVFALGTNKNLTSLFKRGDWMKDIIPRKALESLDEKYLT